MSVAEIIQTPKLTHQPSDWPNLHEPVAEDRTPSENMFSEKQMRLRTEPLYSHWSGPEGDPHFVVAANVRYYFAANEPYQIPNLLVSAQINKTEYLRSIHERRGYFAWRHGKSPDVVIEIVSNKVGGEDTTKPAIYARWGVTYYIIFDPNYLLSEDRLRVLVLSEGQYQRKPDNGWLAALGLGITLWHGVFENQESIWLRWTNKQGELIPTGAEKAALESERANAAEQGKREAEQGKREAEQGKREAEAQRDAERQRNERLLALLKEKGIDVGSL